MERVSCNICGNADSRILWKKGRYNTPVTNVVCTSCGLVYVNPRFTQEEHLAYYASDAYKKKYFQVERPTPEFLAWSMGRAKAEYAFMDDVLHFDAFPFKRMLDVGCSDGALLACFQGRGWRAAGIEPSAQFAAEGRKRYGIAISVGLLEDMRYPAGSFNFVSMIHTLEHTRNPLDTLRTVRMLLAEHGHVYIEVPNIYRPEQSITYFFQEGHLYSFSPATITSLFRKAGLDVVVLNTENRNLRVFGRKGKEREIVPEDYRMLFRFVRRYMLWYHLTGRSLYFSGVRNAASMVRTLFGERGLRLVRKIKSMIAIP